MCKETGSLGLPQLEVLQLKYGQDIIFIANVKYLDGVCVHKDGLVTDNQLLVGLSSVDGDVCITN